MPDIFLSVCFGFHVPRANTTILEKGKSCNRELPCEYTKYTYSGAPASDSSLRSYRKQHTGAARALLTAMDSRERGLGQATFRDFAEFVGGFCSAGGAPYYEFGARGISPRPRGSMDKVQSEGIRQGKVVNGTCL